MKRPYNKYLFKLVHLLIGWFQKISIPYHGWHEYFNPPLPSEIPKCLSPPCPPNSKIANPPSPPEFSTFVSDPLEFLFVCLNLQTNEKLALFPSAEEVCAQFLVRRSSNAVGFYYLHVGVKIGVKYKICQAFYLETRDWCEFSARNNTSSIDNRRETPTWLYFY